MAKLQLNPAVILSPSEDGYHAYDITRNRLYRLNPTAALLVELCDGRFSTEELLAKVSPLFAPEAMQECTTWLQQAITNQMLLDVDAETPAPASAEDLRQLAKDLRRRDLILAAFICQQRATELAPDSASQWYSLAELAHIVGRRELARSGYERYLQVHPDDVEVEHLLVALRDEPPPARASDAYIQQLYSYFAAFYEQNMCDDLEYRAPQLLTAAISAALDDQYGLDVLELGCGTGLFGKLIRPPSRRLVGVDLSAEMIALAAQQNIYDQLIQAELTAWLSAPPSESFDLVPICDTLIYFGDLRQVIPPAAALLKPRGLLAFTVEVGETYPFRLTDNGRYSHHQQHLIEIAREANLTFVSQTQETLRYEYGQPVSGWVTVLRAN